MPFCLYVCLSIAMSFARSLCSASVHVVSFVRMYCFTYVFSIVVCLWLYDVIFLDRCSSCGYVLRVTLCVPFRPSVRMYVFLYVLVCRSFIYVVRS